MPPVWVPRRCSYGPALESIRRSSYLWEAVPTLARGDAERLLRFVSAADDIAAEEPFTPETLTALGELVEADEISYSELDRVRGRVRQDVVREPCDPPHWSPDPADIWDVISNEHPVCMSHQRGHFNALKLSDFWTLRELRRTRTYEIWCRPWRIEHSMSAAIPSPLWHTKTFIFSRRHGDFGERDRLVLDLLQPHFARIWHATRTRRLLVAALTALGGASDQGRRGAVVVDALGRPEFISPPARRLLDEFFGGPADELPTAVVAWIGRRDAAPFVVRSGWRRLRIERSGDALLLAGVDGRRQAHPEGAGGPLLGRAREDERPGGRGALALARHCAEAPGERVCEARRTDADGRGGALPRVRRGGRGRVRVAAPSSLLTPSLRGCYAAGPGSRDGRGNVATPRGGAGRLCC